jgi:predicted transcriptional regulator
MTLKHGDVKMKTVTLEVATLKDVKRRVQDAFRGRKQGARISFATPELLFQLMTAKRPVGADHRACSRGSRHG